MILYACSSNKGKLREFALASEQSGRTDIQLATLPDLHAIPPPEETGTTFEANAVLKSLYYSRFTDAYVFADDSGLEVDALGRAPGVYSARYAGPEASDEENNRLLLRNLAAATDRTARFVCVIALARAGELVTTVSGVVEGGILHQPRGSGGFGYDPLFYYAPLQRTLAELGHEDKLAVSHRGKAIRRLLDTI